MIEKTKQKYDKPSMKVYELKHKPQLLIGSGLGNPGNYPGGGDPWHNN